MYLWIADLARNSRKCFEKLLPASSVLSHLVPACGALLRQRDGNGNRGLGRPAGASRACIDAAHTGAIVSHRWTRQTKSGVTTMKGREQKSKKLAAIAARYREATDFDRGAPHETVSSSTSTTIRLPDKLVAVLKEAARREPMLQRVVEQPLTQRKAAEILGLTSRHVRRLLTSFSSEGPPGLRSRRRGRPSNRRLSSELRQAVLDVVRDQYKDFGPTLANEKLRERHGIAISTETLRVWMVAEELWVPRAQRRRVHQPRNRRECFGELVQIDGSQHAWFEDRGPKCTLLVFIDDATGRLMSLRFVPTESTFDYFAAAREYFETYGKPVAFYSDKHTIFRVADARNREAKNPTQFGRALAELNIEIICANTPQAKGRVERANRTLQDRLVKELRLAGISTIDEGNAFLPTFMADFNKRFAVKPKSQHDAHRPLLRGEVLDEILVRKEVRKVTSDLVVHYSQRLYRIPPTQETLRAAKQHCIVLEREDGSVELRLGAMTPPYSVFDKNWATGRAPVVENKYLDGIIERLRETQKAKLATADLGRRCTRRHVAQIEEQLGAQ